MRKIMYLIFLSLCIPFVALARSVQKVLVEEDNTIATFFTSPSAIAFYGLIVGLALGVLIMRMRSSARRSKNKKRQSRNGNIDDTSFRQLKSVGDDDLDSRFMTLENEHEILKAKCQELERQLAEAEQFSKMGSSSRSFDATSEPFKNGTSGYASTVSVYFLQPTADGRFLAHGKVDKASDALYELTYQSNNPSEASLKFIDVKENTFLAVQNEPTWILVACERSNIPSGNTTSIRTDIPGKAVFTNGEWEIVQKAKITYL